MQEPPNHTVLLDRDGDTWVRFDEWPGSGPAAPAGSWRHISTSGTVWDESARNKVGKGHDWESVQQHGPLEEVALAYAERALRDVEEAWRRD